MNSAPLTQIRSLLFSFSLVLLSCGENGVRNGMNDIDDKSDSKVEVQPKPNRDSLKIDLSKSSVEVTRNKSVKAFDKKMKLFGDEVNVKMDDASFTTTTKLDIKNAYWFLLNGELDEGLVTLDMKSVAALKIAEDEKVEIGNPDYLESKKYPTSALVIKSFKLDPENSNQTLAVASIHIKDTVGEIEFPVTIHQAKVMQNGMEPPDKLTGEFTLDGIKWGLNPKDAKVIKDELMFKVSLSR